MPLCAEFQTQPCEVQPASCHAAHNAASDLTAFSIGLEHQVRVVTDGDGG